METYRIVRHHREGPSELIDTGLTLEEAQAHCQRDDTHGPDWFDGYDRDNLTAEEIAERKANHQRILDAIDAFNRLLA